MDKIDQEISKATKEETELESLKAEQQKLYEEAIKSLGTTLNDDDIFTLIMGGQVKKEIEVIPGKLNAKLCGPRSFDELEAVEKKFAEFTQQTQTKEAMSSYRTLVLLSHAVLELGKPGNLKSIGNNAEERFNSLRNLNTLILETLSAKWNLFMIMLTHTLNQESLIKKA